MPFAQPQYTIEDPQWLREAERRLGAGGRASGGDALAACGPPRRPAAAVRSSACCGWR
jgi:hypothetical protein